MKEIKARIKWSCSGDGKRIRNIPTGTTYYPTLQISDHTIGEMWSVKLIVSSTNDYEESEIIFSMLVDNPASKLFSQQLISGTHFCLYEGPFVVATGIVL